MDIIQQLGLIMGAGWVSGINLYASVAILGISHQAGWIVLPPGLQPVADENIIVLALVLYAINFFVDKTPVIDSGSDMIHTFIRPFGGAMIAYMATQDHGTTAGLAAALLGGTSAAASHATKSTSRAVINTSPEPFSNWMASLTEDAAVLFGAWMTLQHPVLMGIFVILFFFFAFWFIKKCFHFVKGIIARFTQKNEKKQLSVPDNSSPNT